MKALAFLLLIFTAQFSFASGYGDCRAEGWSRDACLNAGEGYRDCRNEGWSRDFCIRAK